MARLWFMIVAFLDIFVSLGMITDLYKKQFP